MKHKNGASRTLAISAIVTVFSAFLASSVTAQPEPRARVNAPGPDIVMTQPKALKTGDNQFEVIVKGADGQPINDAAVSLELVMVRTAVNGWMWKEVKLTPSGNGMYMGSGKLPSKGKWETTIKVKKDGKKIGQKKLALVAA